MKKITKRISNAIERSRLHDKNFIIISNNCWGYEIYKVLGREYNTPFVGLFLFPEGYIKLLENFENCMNSELEFTSTSRYILGTTNYPIGLLCGDIEIHFMHYSTE